MGSQRWPNGVVPYKIQGQFNTDEQNYLNQALASFNTRTNGCIKWVPWTSETNYVTITGRNQGCYSYVGLIHNGSQELNLHPGIPGCLVNSPGIAEHEMLHALGAWHEQSRPDRDQYVTVNEVNVIPDKLHNFD